VFRDSTVTHNTGVYGYILINESPSTCLNVWVLSELAVTATSENIPQLYSSFVTICCSLWFCCNHFSTEIFVTILRVLFQAVACPQAHILLLLLPLALQPAVSFGLSNNTSPFLPILYQLSPSSHSQHLKITFYFLLNPLNPELNPICYLLALLGAHHFLHVSRIRVKFLTLRW